MFQARNRHHTVVSSTILDWRERDPVAASFFDSLSALFPQGERFFIESVRNFRHVVPASISADVAAFIAQEAIHSREHQLFNDQVTAAGLQIESLEARTKRELTLVRQKTPLTQLAFTVGLEHFTAVLAHLNLSEPRLFENAPSETARLWRWHSGEEIEHKAVAFDTLMAATQSWSPVKRWWFRCAAYLEAIVRLLTRVAIPNFIDLSRQGASGSISLWHVFSFFMLKPALALRFAPQLLLFFRPGFHPWQHDDSALAHAALAESSAQTPDHVPAVNQAPLPSYLVAVA